ETPGEQAVFGFAVKLAEPFDGTYVDGYALLEANGAFQLVDKANDFRLHVTVTAIEIMEENATVTVDTHIIRFFGTAVLDGQAVEVAIAAGDFSDLSEPDKMHISVTAGETEIYAIHGDIVKGNIKVS
ncbi:MAG: hypothetical protein PHN53_08200, partial [Eubacteriales bacterium]|nr:hypothetical protein [Eubacteriales bacterium]